MQPHPAFPTLSDLATPVISRMWLGLGPMPSLPDHCPLCSLDISEHPWHAFSCKMLKRKSVLLRHDRACQLLLRLNAQDSSSPKTWRASYRMATSPWPTAPSCLTCLASMYMLLPTRT
jgi:hypothetical protein